MADKSGFQPKPEATGFSRWSIHLELKRRPTHCFRRSPIPALAVGCRPSLASTLRAPYGRLISFPAKWSRAFRLGLMPHFPVRHPAGQPAAVSICSRQIGHSSGSYCYHSVRRIPAPHRCAACASNRSKRFGPSSPAPERLRKTRLERIFASAPQGRGARMRRANSPDSGMPATDAG